MRTRLWIIATSRRPLGLALAAADDADLLLRDAQELRELRDPLVEERLSVDQHERRDSTFRDQVGGEDGLARPGRRDDDADVVGEDRLGGATLHVEQLAAEAEGGAVPGDPLVSKGCRRPPVPEQLDRVLVAAAREAQERALLRGAGDDAGRPVRGEPHRLLLVEVGVLERGETPEAP